ncbi:hypothetical protein A2U01_0113653, partial [Trifolium medium]|nr:hypothetical protein [Trifolium medium]
PRGEECGRVSCLAVEAVLGRDACYEPLGVEDEFWTSNESVWCLSSSVFSPPEQ